MRTWSRCQCTWLKTCKCSTTGYSNKLMVVIGIVIARVIVIVIVMVRCQCTWLKTCKCSTTGYSDSNGSNSYSNSRCNIANITITITITIILIVMVYYSNSKCNIRANAPRQQVRTLLGAPRLFRPQHLPRLRHVSWAKPFYNGLLLPV